MVKKAITQIYGGKGPQYFINTRKTWQTYANPDILSGILTYNNNTIQLRSNRISFYRLKNSDTVHIYHSYSYNIPNDKTVYHGRWYNTKIPLEEIHLLPNNMFTHIVQDYELENKNNDIEFVEATFTLTFSPKFAQQIRSLTQLI